MMVVLRRIRRDWRRRLRRHKGVDVDELTS